MRKLMMILAVGILLVMAGCPMPVDLPPVVSRAIVNVSTTEGFNTTTFMGNLSQKVSIVSGFEHVYDTCQLTVNNQTSSQQSFYKNPIEPIFLDISLSKGMFSFYVSSNEDPLLIDFTKSFIAFSQPDSVRGGEVYNLTLPEEVQQALVLVDANTVDEVPTIEIGLTTLPMQRQGDYWFAYVLGPGALNAKISGADVTKGFPWKQGNIYVWSAVKGNIMTEDGFTEVIYI